MIKTFNQFINESEQTLTVYHGTSKGNGENLVQNGWEPRKHSSSGNQGNSSYLYVSSEKEDAMWFANEIGEDTVVQISNVPISDLRPDPEDESGFSMKQLLDRIETSDMPAKFIISKPLDKSFFKII